MASRQYSRVMLNAISVKMFKGETIEEEEDIEISWSMIDVFNLLCEVVHFGYVENDLEWVN